MKPMPSIHAAPTAEYRCPGQRYTISRAVHLGRLASFFAACRDCPHHDDTGELSPRTLRRLEETRARGQAAPLFFEEGMAGVCPNDFGPAAARGAAVALGMLLQRQRAEISDAPVVLIAGDGRPLTAEIHAAIGEGLRWAACHVVDLGPATAPCLALAIDHLQAAGGLLLGNPADRPQTAGLKFWAHGPRPLSAGGLLDDLAAIYASPVDRPTRSYGSRRRFQADEPYLASLAEEYHALRPLRICSTRNACRWPAISAGSPRRWPAKCSPAPALRENWARRRWRGLRTSACRSATTARSAASRTSAAARCPATGSCCCWRGSNFALVRAGQSWWNRTRRRKRCKRSSPGAANRSSPAPAGRRSTRPCGKARPFWAAGPAGDSGSTPRTAPDALRAATQLLVLLSRSDRRFSTVLDAETVVR